MFSKKLNAKLDQYHLLNHPFYKSWNEGKLTREIIKDYAEQYYQHVKAFPRYISATHSLCEDIEKRKILLENLQGLKNHYGCSSKKGLEFFEAHKSADVHHRAECEKLLDGLSKEEQVKAEKAALSTAKYLWNFLSGMSAKHNLSAAA